MLPERQKSSTLRISTDVQRFPCLVVWVAYGNLIRQRKFPFLCTLKGVCSNLNNLNHRRSVFMGTKADDEEAERRVNKNTEKITEKKEKVSAAKLYKIANIYSSSHFPVRKCFSLPRANVYRFSMGSEISDILHNGAANCQYNHQDKFSISKALGEFALVSLFVDYYQPWKNNPTAGGSRDEHLHCNCEAHKPSRG